MPDVAVGSCDVAFTQHRLSFTLLTDKLQELKQNNTKLDDVITQLNLNLTNLQLAVTKLDHNATYLQQLNKLQAQKIVSLEKEIGELQQNLTSLESNISSPNTSRSTYPLYLLPSPLLFHLLFIFVDIF